MRTTRTTTHKDLEDEDNNSCRFWTHRRNQHAPTPPLLFERATVSPYVVILSKKKCSLCFLAIAGEIDGSAVYASCRRRN